MLGKTYKLLFIMNVILGDRMLKFLAPILVLIPSFTNAGWIAEQAKVVAVESTSGNGDTFTAIVRGGAGPCVSTSQDRLIFFPRSEASTTDIHNRTYSMMLAALSSGAKVSIFNYVDSSCDKAVGVRMIGNGI